MELRIDGSKGRAWHAMKQAVERGQRVWSECAAGRDRLARDTGPRL